MFAIFFQHCGQCTRAICKRSRVRVGTAVLEQWLRYGKEGVMKRGEDDEDEEGGAGEGGSGCAGEGEGDEGSGG